MKNVKKGQKYAFNMGNAQNKCLIHFGLKNSEQHV